MSVRRVIMVGPLRDVLEQALRDRFGATPYDDLAPGLHDDVAVAVTSFEAGVRAEHLDRLPALGAVVNFGVGYDSTDVVELARRGVALSNTPDVLTDCVADAAVGLLIDVMRGLSAGDRFVRRGDWAAGLTYPLARRVTGARVGILGLGRIGTAIGRRLEAFDCTISYHNRRERPDAAYAYADSPAALAADCDVLLVAAAGGPDSQRLVDREVLDALGAEGILVNVARGSVLDQSELVAALVEGRLAGAGLDVFEDEPDVPAELLDRDDVVLLPHVGSATVETRGAMTELALANVERFLTDGTLVTPVDL